MKPPNPYLDRIGDLVILTNTPLVVKIQDKKHAEYLYKHWYLPMNKGHNEREVNKNMYCVKCKEHRNSVTTPEKVITKNGKSMLRGECEVCHTKMTKFIKKDESKM